MAKIKLTKSAVDAAQPQAQAEASAPCLRHRQCLRNVRRGMAACAAPRRHTCRQARNDGRQDKRTRHRAASKASPHMGGVRHAAPTAACRRKAISRIGADLCACHLRSNTPCSARATWPHMTGRYSGMRGRRRGAGARDEAGQGLGGGLVGAQQVGIQSGRWSCQWATGHVLRTAGGDLRCADQRQGIAGCHQGQHQVERGDCFGHQWFEVHGAQDARDLVAVAFADVRVTHHQRIAQHVLQRNALVGQQGGRTGTGTTSGSLQASAASRPSPTSSDCANPTS